MASEQAVEVTLSDLGQLTLRANVAFAVRCALRVRPRFNFAERTRERQEQAATVDAAIQAADAFARAMSDGHRPIGMVARAAYGVAELTCEQTHFAAYAAAHAAQAAAHAADAGAHARVPLFLEIVAGAYGAGRVVRANTPNSTALVVMRAMRADFDKLLSLSLGKPADAGQPVDPSESGPLGPLWPSGAPFWYDSRAD